MLRSAQTRLVARYCRGISLTLAGCLPFLVPFDPLRNIDMQGYLLIVSGVFAWLAIILGYYQMVRLKDPGAFLLLSIFLTTCFISFVVHPHYGNGFFGAPYIRLGAGSFLACAGIGLLARSLQKNQLIVGLYSIIIGLAVLATPYTWWHFRTLIRIGGSFSQADVFACFLGCGLLLGLELFNKFPRWRTALLVSQSALIVLLALTQTRAVLILVFALGACRIVQLRQKYLFREVAIYILVALASVTLLHFIQYDRLTDTSYASRSLTYRVALQQESLHVSTERPIFGYGPGNVADALRCNKLTDEALQATCHDGYYFNSSHNIFIDRVLAIGWLGGMAFATLVMLAIYRSFHDKEQIIFGYGLLLISGYYLTNVTESVLELLLWILLMYCLQKTDRPAASTNRVSA